MRTRVTLTFDNGPTRVTAQVLDVLAARGLSASFFLVGERLRQRGMRVLAERAAREGHRIGNHSLNHATPLGVNDDPVEAEQEIEGMQALLGELVTGERFFRPFGGGGVIDRNLLGRHALEHLMRGGYTCVLWSSVLTARPWSVVVLHDLPTGAMARLPAFLDALDARGIEVVHELPEDCVPIRFGRPTSSFSALPVSV